LDLRRRIPKSLYITRHLNSIKIFKKNTLVSDIKHKKNDSLLSLMLRHTHRLLRTSSYLQKSAHFLQTSITILKSKKDVHAVLSLYEENAHNLNAIHLANIYGTLAQNVKGPRLQKLKSDSRFTLLFENTIAKLQTSPSSFGARAIATITHSVGKMRFSDQRFFDVVSNLRERIVKEGEVQTMSNVCWAFATNGHRAEELFGLVAGEHERIAKEGKTQELSNTCWAFAKVDIQAEELFNSVANEHERIARDGKVQVSERS